jgi:hypothetical protein
MGDEAKTPKCGAHSISPSVWCLLVLFSLPVQRNRRLSFCTQKQVNCFENIAFSHWRTKHPELFTKFVALIIAGEQKEWQLVISLAPLSCERIQFLSGRIQLE